MRTLTRRVGIGLAATAAISLGAGINAASAEAYYAYQIAPINGHQAFGIGPMSTQGECQTKANYLNQIGAKKYGSGFGVCVHDPAVGWLATSPWAQ